MIEREFSFALNTSDIGKYIRDRVYSGDGKSLRVVIMPMAGPDVSGRHFFDGRGYQVSSERRPAQLLGSNAGIPFRIPVSMNPALLPYSRAGEVCLMKPKTYTYMGDTIPDLDQPEYAGFLGHLEKSILYSLEKRNLLSPAQRDRCLLEIDKLHTKDHNKHRM